MISGDWMRSTLFLTLIGAILLAGCAAHRTVTVTPTAVLVDDAVREALPNDYLRVSFLPAGVPVTSLNREGALRAFATATPLFSPPLSLRDFPYYSGLINDDAKTLVAMRCKPQKPETVDAVLATWPNVFGAIQRDVPSVAGLCESQPTNPASQAVCFARNFTDPPQVTVPTSLARTFGYAATIFDADHIGLAGWLQDKYGIFPAFSGTGYSVKDSYSLSGAPMNSQQILVKSVSSEYILKNVSLTEAGCRCISVPPYKDRSNDRLDPDFIDKKGGQGICTSVERLPQGGQPGK